MIIIVIIIVIVIVIVIIIIIIIIIIAFWRPAAADARRRTAAGRRRSTEVARLTGLAGRLPAFAWLPGYLVAWLPSCLPDLRTGGLLREAEALRRCDVTSFQIALRLPRLQPGWPPV